MGSLSNLYISQSYVSLIHLGSDSFITTQSVELQDGLGNGLGIFVNSLGDVNIQGAFSASNIPSDIASQAELNAYTASTNIRLNNIETTTASLNSSVSQLNASSASQQVSINALNSYTQSTNVRLNSLEAATSSYANSASVAAVDAAQQQSINSLNSVTASFLTSSTDISALNAFTASQISFNSSATASISQLLSFSSSLDTNFVTEGELASATGSLISQINTKLNTSSFNAYTQSNNQRVNSLETNSASVNISINNLNSTTASQATSISNLNTFTQSANISINALNSATSSYVTETESGSFLITASFDNGNRNLTFTKGDNTTFNVNIPDVSGSAGDFVTTASFNQYTQSNDQRVNSLESNSASVNVSISNINSTTASLNSSVSQLNASSASQQISIDSLNGATSSYANSASVALVDANQQLQINSLIAATGSYLTASADITALNAFTASQLNINTGYNTFTSSANQRLSSLETTSASVNISVSQLNVSSASQQISIDNLNAATSSYITESETASFARTNIDNNFTANQTFTNITAVSASFTYVQTLFETASVIYSSGSNQFGDELTDTQTLSGSVKVQGSLTVNGVPVQTSSFDPSALNQATASLQAFTQSAEVRLNNIESTTASLNTSVSNLNTFSASALVSISNLNASSASQQVSIDALNVFTASQSTASIVTSINELNTFTSSANIRLNNIESTTASLLVETYNLELFSASALTSLSNLNTATASLFTSASLALTTASISGDILTFTKGDASTFSVTFPTGSGALPAGLLSSSVTNFVDYSASVDSRINGIVTGTGFATTGSNSFNGNQIITGSMTSSLNILVAGVPMGFGNLAGTSSIAIGVSALSSNTGNANIAIGTRAGQQNTTGGSNLAIGLDALQRNTTGGQNVGLGEAALRENRTGTGNVVIGNNAAQNAGNVTGNTIVGKAAAQNVKNNYNTIVGETAALNITSGSNNTIVGQAAGVDIGSGSNNIFIGQNAGRLISGSNNTLVGSAQGVGNWSNVIAISDGQQNIRALFSGSEWDLTGSLDVSGSFTASLQQGHLYVGNANGRTTTIATSSLVVSIDTGSLVTTASFNTYTSSNDQRVSSLETNSASVNTSISNLNTTTASLLIQTANLETFSASALVSISNLNANSASQQVSIDALNVFTASQSTASLVTSITNLNQFTQSAEVRLNNIESTTASLLIQTSNLETFSASALVSINALNAATNSYVTETESGSFLITASFASQTLTFTKGDNTTFSVTIPDVSGSTINTGSFATTGSNVFTGDQTFIDNANNFFTISDASGSMMLVAKGFTSASAHISASAAGIGNLIFKTNNNTQDTIISGSNNLFVNAAASSGFKRYIGGSGNIMLNASNVPALSGSMAFSPTMNNNYFGGNSQTLTMRGPVSSSAWTISANSILGAVNIGQTAANHAQGIVSGLTLTGNITNGTLNIVANKANLTQNLSLQNNNIGGTLTLTPASSSIIWTGNTTQGTITLTNEVSGSGLTVLSGSNSIYGNQNIIGGQLTINASGAELSDDPAAELFLRTLERNLIAGHGNNVRLNGATSSSLGLSSTAIIGNNLTVTGSNSSPTFGTPQINYGSAFFGRYNAQDGNKALSAQTVFAVGTGTSSARKTGFLIDSASNAFFEGGVNISGSLTINGVPYSIIDTASFATTGSNSFNGNQRITGSLTMSGSILFVDRSGNTSNVYLGLDALGMGGPSASPNALGNTIGVAIGNGAMQYASGSNQNVAIGNNALQITTGSKNIAVGSEALSDNTTGAENIGIGAASLTKNTTGEQNVGIGFSALFENTTGAYNLAIGSYALSQNISSSNSVAIGYNALQKNQSDTQTAIGVNALKENTVGERNLAIGYAAAEQNTIGDYNTAIGGFAMNAATASQNNIAIGYQSMYAAESTNNNTAIGVDALYNVKSNSSANTAIGYQAMRNHFVQSLSGAGQNTAIGYDAMASVTTGSQNVGIGNGALRDAIFAHQNVFIGHAAGVNTSGSVDYNTVVGGSSGRFIAGTRNTILGNSNGNALSSSANDNNTIIGCSISGEGNWANVIAIGNGNGDIKFFNSGSQTTITNDTLISGSLTVTGSTVLSGSFYIQSGSNLPNGTTERVLTYDTTTGQVRQATLASILSASFDAAEFYSTTTQSGSAGVSGSITFNNSGSVAGVSLANNTQVTVSQAGTYNIQFSAQIETSAGADTVYIWFKKNGTNIAASASKAVLANNTAQIMTVNLFDEAVANDYYELAYQNLNGHATVLAEVASGNIPAIPSVILTIQQIR